jgi:hypothetical protein
MRTQQAAEFLAGVPAPVDSLEFFGRRRFLVLGESIEEAAPGEFELFRRDGVDLLVERGDVFPGLEGHEGSAFRVDEVTVEDAGILFLHYSPP